MFFLMIMRHLHMINMIEDILIIVDELLAEMFYLLCCQLLSLVTGFKQIPSLIILDSSRQRSLSHEWFCM